MSDLEFENHLLRQRIEILEEQIEILLKINQDLKAGKIEKDGLIAFVSAGVLGLMREDCPAAVELYKEMGHEYEAIRESMKYPVE